jgi:hypothetical protein
MKFKSSDTEKEEMENNHIISNKIRESTLKISNSHEWFLWLVADSAIMLR